MTRQSNHRDRVSQAIFDTSYNYGAIHKAQQEHGGPPPIRINHAVDHAGHTNKLLWVVLRDAEQSEDRYPWGEAARRFADTVALAAVEYTAAVHESLACSRLHYYPTPPTENYPLRSKCPTNAIAAAIPICGGHPPAVWSAPTEATAGNPTA